MSIDAAKHLLDEFNEGNWDEFGAYFNDDFETFYGYLDKYDLAGDIDFSNSDSDYENIILLKKLEKYPEETLKYICDQEITDVYPMKGGYYLYLKDRDELGGLFGNDDSRSAARAILNEDFWEPFWDTTNDVYSDVIEELNEKNIQNLANYILKHVGDQDLPLDYYDNDLFHYFSEQQGTEGVFKITTENVMEFINDEGAMKEMLKKDLDVLKSELYSIHSSAYNTAYSDEIYDDVWSELEQYFDRNSFEHEEKTKHDGTKFYHEYIKINDFEHFISRFLYLNKDQQWNDQRLSYYGTYCGLLLNMMDNNELEWLNFRVPDYPYWSLIKKYINEFFNDYII